MAATSAATSRNRSLEENCGRKVVMLHRVSMDRYFASQLQLTYHSPSLSHPWSCSVTRTIIRLERLTQQYLFDTCSRQRRITFNINLLNQPEACELSRGQISKRTRAKANDILLSRGKREPQALFGSICILHRIDFAGWRESRNG